MDISFQNSTTSQTNINEELKTEPDIHISTSFESHFTKKNVINANINLTETQQEDKADIYAKRKKLNLKKSLSKTLSSIVISIRKML